MQIQRFGGALGAEVSGIDLASPLAAEDIAALRAALVEHQVLFFHEQRFEPGSLARFGRHFGELNRHPYVTPLKGHPDVFAIIKEAEDRHHFGSGWHSDLSYAERPALGTLLFGVEIPPAGGDTVFASTAAAYEALSPGMRGFLDGMTAINSNERSYGPSAQRFEAAPKSMAVSQQQQVTEVEHPVVRTHPESGRKGLFINPIHTQRFKGWTREESQPLLDFLYQHIGRPEFACRFRWKNGSLAFWDNRLAWHCAVNDFPGQRRSMLRVTVEGDRPF